MICCITRAREGDPWAAEALVENLRPRITRMAAYYGRRCGEDPDDLVQEAWLGLLEALPELDMEIGSPEQHLIARARWRVLDALKRARVRRCASLDDGALDPRYAARPAECHVETACVTEFVEQLKLFHRRILACLMAGLTWRETGRMLGCTSANIAYHVRQIRRKYEEWSRDIYD